MNQSGNTNQEFEGSDSGSLKPPTRLMQHSNSATTGSAMVVMPNEAAKSYDLGSERAKLKVLVCYGMVCVVW